MKKGKIVRISVILFLVGILNLVIVPHTLDAQNLEQVDLLDQNTMESINNTIIRESVTLILQFDFDTDMDGIPDVYEPGFEFDFDNDGDQPDNLSNPVRPNTGPDEFDHDSDNDGIEDWPWGNDTILLNLINGRSKSSMDLSERFLIYIDEINDSAMLQFSPVNKICELNVSEISEGKHLIYVQHIINDGYNINTTTYELYIEIYIEIQKDTINRESFSIIWEAVIVTIIVLSILLFVLLRLQRKLKEK